METVEEFRVQCNLFFFFCNTSFTTLQIRREHLWKQVLVFKGLSIISVSIKSINVGVIAKQFVV